MVKHDAKPKAKRVNFNINRIVSPFRPDWKTLMSCDIGNSDTSPNGTDSSLAPLFFVVREPSVLDSVRRGNDVDLPERLFNRALVRVDIRCRYKGVPHDNALICVATKDDHDSIRDGQGSWSGIQEPRPSDENTPIPTRDVLGCVVHGRFSRLRGYAHGYGYVCLSKLMQLDPAS